MFLAMIFIHIFIMPWIMIAKPSDFRISVTQVYAAIFMGTCMVIAEAFIHPLSISGWLLCTALLAASTYCLRNQFFVSDTEYLHDMIPHHSMAVLTSVPRAQRTRNSMLRELAQSIVKTQEQEITLMKSLAMY